MFLTFTCFKINTGARIVSPIGKAKVLQFTDMQNIIGFTRESEMQRV